MTFSFELIKSESINLIYIYTIWRFNWFSIRIFLYFSLSFHFTTLKSSSSFDLKSSKNHYQFSVLSLWHPFSNVWQGNQFKIEKRKKLLEKIYHISITDTLIDSEWEKSRFSSHLFVINRSSLFSFSLHSTLLFGAIFIPPTQIVDSSTQKNEHHFALVA